MTSSPSPETRNLRVLIADESKDALVRLRGGLEQLGHEVIPFAVSAPEAVELIGREDPDIAIVMVHEDDDHALTLISEAVEYASGPVIAHVNGADPVEFIQRAAARGISAYVSSDAPGDLQGAIEVSMHRHGEQQQLAEKVDQLQTALDRRAIIERAKGMLMERHGLDEREAFDCMRNHARSAGRRVVDVARDVTDGQPLLPRR